MLARLGSGLALAAVAALALVGCSPPEPVATTPAAAPTVEPSVITVEDATDAYGAYASAVQAMFDAREADAEVLNGVATPAAAEVASADVQSTLDAGFQQTVPPSMASIELEPGATETTAYALLCLDATDAEIIDITTGEAAERTTDPFTDWRLGLERHGADVLVSSYESIGPDEASPCES
ncbi:hypothetical protein [Agrococcus sp. BE272]|uniref:hypothetical protein n=1 Tax=Agrococcus sp. BE272 TaxID=2817727 RepID=UPI0028616C68|nr:hypothetical protein [Agrococcus sp. BE272]MDR7233664.1 hypothetical protein [Agrococcus sp. BE272]